MMKFVDGELVEMTAEEIAEFKAGQEVFKTPTASLTRAEFVTALSKVPTPPIFTENEALAALEAFPTKFTAALEGKPMTYRAEAVEAWRNAKTVSRYDPLFLDLLDFYAKQSGLDTKGAEDLGNSIFSVTNET